MTSKIAAGTDDRAPIATSERQLWLFLGAYAILLCSLLSKLSLWLDEIVDLRGIRDYDVAHLIAWVPANAGGVPLGYLTRFVTVHALGYSTFSGRLPSAVFSLVACAGVFVLAQRLKLRFPLIPVVLFAFTPLQLRYALESRPYSLGLALSVWATALFVSLLERATLARALLYGLITLLGLYTQPYMVFVPAAHIAWLCCVRAYPGRGRLLLFASVPLAFAAAGFAPWYLWTTHVWNQSVAADHLQYTVQPKAALLILRELVGAGYIGSGLVLAAAWVGLKYALPTQRARLFWVLYTVLPVVLALIGDAVFGYFLAIRQMIFVLTPLCLLAALGLEKLAAHRRRIAAVAGCILMTTFLIADVRFFLRPREDWSAAADILAGLTERGACILFTPASSEGLYEFSAPGLAQKTCRGQLSGPVALAISPYGHNDQPQIAKVLSDSGLHKARELNLQGPKIEVYER